ncbi:MAG: hypothetical protein WAK93_07130 [Solirubrobacteraceae bacterium]
MSPEPIAGEWPGGPSTPRLGETHVNQGKLICAAVALCLALAACGGSSSSSSSTASLSAFKSKFATDQTQFRQFGTQLGSSIAAAGSKTDATLASEFAKLSSTAKSQATALSNLNPPAKYKPTVDRLASAFNAIAADLSSISSAASKHDASAAETATKKLVGDAATVKSADTALSKPLGLNTPAA